MTSQVDYHGLWIKFALVFLLCLGVVWLVYCNLSAPIKQNDICSLFRAHPQWYWSAKVSEKKWGVPISEQMAIMQKESHFRASAQPPHRRLLGFIPWQRVSTATGYMQALDATWRSYLRGTHQRSASREDFSKATDFIGWYVEGGHRRTGVSKRDAFRNYLIYHEGVGGYLRHSYESKPWLVRLARNVAWRADLYHRQLTRCERHLPQRSWWRFW